MLRRLLKSVQMQNYRNVEVILTLDESQNNLDKVIAEFEKDVKISSFYDAPLGISANTNFAVSKARGSIIKVLYQDDFLSDKYVITRIVRKFKRSGKSWLLSGSNDFYENTGKFSKRIIPKFSHELFEGKNTISSPSVASFRAEKFVPLSVELNMMLDIDWYLRMLHNFGPPIVDRRISVTNGVHNYQAQRAFQKGLLLELELMRSMHDEEITFVHNVLKDCKCVAQENQRYSCKPLV